MLVKLRALPRAFRRWPARVARTRPREQRGCVVGMKRFVLFFWLGEMMAMWLIIDWLVLWFDWLLQYHWLIMIAVMWVKQCHKPPMTGNGKHTVPPIKMVMTGEWSIMVLPTLNQWILGTCHCDSIVQHTARLSQLGPWPWKCGTATAGVGSIKSCSFMFQYVPSGNLTWLGVMGFNGVLMGYMMVIH